jgi:hypothetical protein
LHVAFGGALGDHQPRGDVLVGQSFRDEFGDLLLPTSQRCSRGIRRGGGRDGGRGCLAERVGNGPVEAEADATAERGLERAVAEGMVGLLLARLVRDDSVRGIQQG